jgi:RNA polymerase sigma-70 factor, ECF subfamily
MQNATLCIESTERFEVVDGRSAAHEFHKIVSSRLPSLYRSAYRLLGNTADAEDAVQDALLAAHKNLGQFKGRSQMATWVTAIVHNSARMHLRRRLRHIHVSLEEPIGDTFDLSLTDRLADAGPTPEAECCDSELNNYLRRLTARLSPILLRAFQLRDIDGLSTREAAQILGIPNGTVKVRLARARKRLKELLPQTLRPEFRNLTGMHKRVLAA